MTTHEDVTKKCNEGGSECPESFRDRMRPPRMVYARAVYSRGKAREQLVTPLQIAFFFVKGRAGGTPIIFLEKIQNR